jgi:DNA polymerase III alpha subunit
VAVPEFAHLHLHTEFSLLDGMGRIDQYVARAQELGIQHLAVTDHGVMYAAMDWYQAAVAGGLHPIIGMEAYLAMGPSPSATGSPSISCCWQRTTSGIATCSSWPASPASTAFTTVHALIWNS